MTAKIETIFLDLDDVIVDFYGSALKLFPEVDNVDMSEWNMEKALGVSHEEFWQRITAQEHFWEDLPWLPWGLYLYKELCKVAPVVFATSPSSCPYAAAGKIKWLHKYFGSNFRKFVLVQDKEVLARRNTVLIDDGDVNVDTFRDARGYALAFPRPWNRSKQFASDPANSVLNDLAFIQAYIIEGGI